MKISRSDIAFVSLQLASGLKVAYYSVQQFNIARGLKKYFDVSLVTSEHIDLPRHHKLDGIIDVYCLPTIGIPLLKETHPTIGTILMELERILHSIDPKIVISCEDFNLTSLRTIKYCKRKQIPSIIYQGPYFYVGIPTGTLHRIFAKTLGSFIYNNAGFFVAKTRRAKQFLIKLGCNPQRIAVIPPPIDTELFRPRKVNDEKLPFPLEEKRIILQVGASRIGKNTFTLLKAFRILKKFYKDIALLIVVRGDNPFKASLKQAIKNLKMQHDVHILEDVPNYKMPLIYQSAYVTVSPSLREIFGMNILESLSCGTPVVATPTAGAEEMIIDGVNGLICPDFSLQSLVNCLYRMLNDESLYLKIKKNARKSIVGKFDIDSIGRKWSILLKEIIN